MSGQPTEVDRDLVLIANLARTLVDKGVPPASVRRATTEGIKRSRAESRRRILEQRRRMAIPR